MVRNSRPASRLVQPWRPRPCASQASAVFVRHQPPPCPAAPKSGSSILSLLGQRQAQSPDRAQQSVNCPSSGLAPRLKQSSTAIRLRRELQLHRPIVNKIVVHTMRDGVMSFVRTVCRCPSRKDAPVGRAAPASMDELRAIVEASLRCSISPQELAPRPQRRQPRPTRLQNLEILERRRT